MGDDWLQQHPRFSQVKSWNRLLVLGHAEHEGRTCQHLAASVDVPQQLDGSIMGMLPVDISTTGNTISAGREGDRMYGSMIRTKSDTWQILTTVNGKTSTLNAQVGPWAYTWAVATFEDYG